MHRLRVLTAEARANLQLALPLIAAQIAVVGMGTVDTILAGRISGDALAAVAIGANVSFLPLVFFMGVCMAVSPIVAQRVGAGHPAAAIGGFVRGALVAGTLLGLAWIALVQLSVDPVLDWLALEPPVRALAEPYLRVLAFAGLPFSLCFVLRGTAEGHGLTRVPLIAGLSGAFCNVAGAYTLAFGAFGAPALGPLGIGCATVGAAWVIVLVFLASFHYAPPLRALHLWRRGGPDVRQSAREILSVGGPIGLIMAAEAWLFIIGGLLMARFGGEVVAAHQVAINFASLTFMVPLSIGLATTVRVGQAAGAGRRAWVAVRGRVGMLLGMAFALVSASGMTLFPTAIAALYTDAAGVTARAAHFLSFAAVFQLFDCIQATANGALRGLKDTKYPMVITVTAYWLVGMPLGVRLAFFTDAGPSGIWIGFIAGLATAATGLAWRFLRLAGHTERAPTRAPYGRVDQSVAESSSPPPPPATANSAM
jgi:MATE family multidrug resistance protein